MSVKTGLGFRGVVEMNCSQLVEHLAELVYGEASRNEIAGIEEHLAACPACRRQYEELKQVRRMLALVAAPAVEVDLPALYRRAAAATATRAVRRRQAFRWAMAAAAAAVMTAFLLGLEVRLDRSQLVLRWAKEIDQKLVAAPAPRAEAIPKPELESISAKTVEQLRLLRELVHAMVRDAETRDLRQWQTLSDLEGRLAGVQRQLATRWDATERDVAALYRAQFVLPGKGEQP
jgi:hypothetical protein